MTNISVTEPKFQIGDLVCHIASLEKTPMVVIGQGHMGYEGGQQEIMYMCSSFVDCVVKRTIFIEGELEPSKLTR